MLVFGLTGGIGCGKSTVSKHWASKGLPVIDADLLSRQAIDQDTLITIGNTFGKGVLSRNGTLARGKLGRIVFNDLKALKQLEEILRPRMSQLMQKELIRHEKAGAKLVCYDSAILVEKEEWTRYRPIVVVHVPIEIQLERLRTRNPKHSNKDILSRVFAQMPGVRRLRFADYVIDNSRDVNDTLKSADVVLRSIEGLI